MPFPGNDFAADARNPIGVAAALVDESLDDFALGGLFAHRLDEINRFTNVKVCAYGTAGVTGVAAAFRIFFQHQHFGAFDACG